MDTASLVFTGSIGALVLALGVEVPGRPAEAPTPTATSCDYCCRGGQGQTCSCTVAGNACPAAPTGTCKNMSICQGTCTAGACPAQHGEATDSRHAAPAADSDQALPTAGSTSCSCPGASCCGRTASACSATCNDKEQASCSCAQCGSCSAYGPYGIFENSCTCRPK